MPYMSFITEGNIMTITQLIYFREVCDHQGVTAAANAIHVSQPTISNAIKELEDEFNVNLFTRYNKKMILTEEGRYFYSHIGSIIDQILEIEDKMRNFGNLNKRLKIGVPPMIGTFLFPDMFSQFNRQAPDIEFEIVEHGSVKTLELLEQNLLDLAIVIYDNTQQKQFYSLPLLETQMVYCVSKTHPMASRSSINLSELAQEPLILMKNGSYQSQLLIRSFKELGIEPKVLLRTEQLYTIQQYITHQYATGFVIKEAAQLSEDMVGIPLDPPIPISVDLIWDANKYLHNSAVKFIQFAKENYS